MAREYIKTSQKIDAYCPKCQKRHKIRKNYRFVGRRAVLLCAKCLQTKRHPLPSAMNSGPHGNKITPTDREARGLSKEQKINYSKDIEIAARKFRRDNKNLYV